jgi:S1-C subfamily serine protease
MDIAESLRPAVVAILDGNGNVIGTGFFVTRDGYILTCYHLVKDYLVNKEVKIKTYNGDELAATLDESKSYPDDVIDFAILKADGQGPFSCLPLGRDFKKKDR